MKYCARCGKEMGDNDIICTNCGMSVDDRPMMPQGQQDPDIPSPLFSVLGFLFPIIGIALYFAWRRNYPNKAKRAGMWGLIGFTVNLILSFILYFI